MGHFRAKNKMNKFKKWNFIIFTVILVMVLSFFSCKYKLDKEILKNFTLAYLGFNYTIKENIDIVETKADVHDDNEHILPIIYIYNTHQSEKYQYDKIADYNIDYNVLFASNILSSYLGDISIVEKTNINEILQQNDYRYYESYKASRILMQQQKEANPSLEYYIDLHRDSSEYDITTCDVNGVKYAKILFVVGLEHDNYEKNLEFANGLNNALMEVNGCFTRGILKKQGAGVNGVYNQDFSDKSILIEVGGQYNTIDEVNNILKVFADVYKKYIGVVL